MKRESDFPSRASYCGIDWNLAKNCMIWFSTFVGTYNVVLKSKSLDRPLNNHDNIIGIALPYMAKT